MFLGAVNLASCPGGRAADATTGLGAPRGRGAAPGGQICCTSPELDFGRHRAPRPLVSRGRSRELVYRGTLAYHVGAERQGTLSPPPLLFSAGDRSSVFKNASTSPPRFCALEVLRQTIQARESLFGLVPVAHLTPAENRILSRARQAALRLAQHFKLKLRNRARRACH